MAAKKREPAWATRLRDLRRDFVAANKRSRLRFVLVQTIGANVKGLQPSDDENCSRTRTAVTLGDGTPAVRWVYRFGRDNDPAVALIERGNDILKRHGDEILKLFGLKFVDSWESNWPWLLARLAEVEHHFRGDIKSDRTLAGVASPNEMAEAVAFRLGQGPKPSWLDKRNKSFRADIPHVAVASIAAIRAILERVDALSAATDKLGSRKEPAAIRGKERSRLTWQKVLPKAESYVQRCGFPGLKALARECGGCHHETLRRAIDNSDKLRKAEQTSLERKKTAIPKRRQQRINAVLADSLPSKTNSTDSIATDDIFRRAIEAAETDEKRDKLSKMSAAERREWVAFVSDDPDAEFSFGKPKRVPGRARVKRK